jgi:hypothetical protein
MTPHPVHGLAAWLLMRQSHGYLLAYIAAMAVLIGVLVMQ